MENALDKLMTLKRLRAMRGDQQKIAMLTCYDATTASWLQRAGVHCLLVGDSAANVILGYDSSIHVTLDFLITLTAAVKRGAPNAFVLGDMPFMSYQVNDEQAIENAGRMMTEGKADAVKFEVDGAYTDMVAKLSRAGIPVVAHLGWCPQRTRQAGVKTALVRGRTAEDVKLLVDEAQQMVDHGAVMLLLEQCTEQVAEQLVTKVDVPIIGCGAGPYCDGDVVVLQDLLGMTDRQPSFAPPIANAGEALKDAALGYMQKLQAGTYVEELPYKMYDGEAEKL